LRLVQSQFIGHLVGEEQGFLAGFVIAHGPRHQYSKCHNSDKDNPSHSVFFFIYGREDTKKKNAEPKAKSKKYLFCGPALAWSSGVWLCDYAEIRQPFDEIKHRHTINDVGDVAEGKYDWKIEQGQGGVRLN
jgi:hypothetical protein